MPAKYHYVTSTVPYNYTYKDTPVHTCTLKPTVKSRQLYFINNFTYVFHYHAQTFVTKFIKNLHNFLNNDKLSTQ